MILKPVNNLKIDFALIAVEILLRNEKRLKRIAGESSKRTENEKITLYSSTLILASCYNVERNCKDFKTGKFRFDYEVDGVTKTTILNAMTA
jgi:hypothetical protein